MSRNSLIITSDTRAVNSTAENLKEIFAKCDKISWRLNKILKTLNDLLKLETQQKLVINSAKESLKHWE